MYVQLLGVGEDCLVMSWHLTRVPTAATLPTKLKSQLEVQKQTRMSHHHCCCTVEAVIMIELLLLGPQFFTSQNCLLFFYNIRMISCKLRTKN